MAIQNFLDGGFYGKLGNLVGERWHNKRYIRTYVKTPNPKTPKQVAWQALFKRACRLAQLAMNINGHQGIWDTSRMGEFPARLGQALSALRDGRSDEEALPLYPGSYNPQTKVTLTRIAAATPTQLTLFFPETSINENRSIEFGILCFASASSDPIQLSVREVLPANASELTLVLPQACNMYAKFLIAGASNDDILHGGVSVEFIPYEDYAPNTDLIVYPWKVLTHDPVGDMAIYVYLNNALHDVPVPIPITFTLVFRLRPGAAWIVVNDKNSNITLSPPRCSYINRDGIDDGSGIGFGGLSQPVENGTARIFVPWWDDRAQ